MTVSDHLPPNRVLPAHAVGVTAAADGGDGTGGCDQPAAGVPPNDGGRQARVTHVG